MQKARGRNWVSSEITQMLTLYREGYNIEEIALKIDRTPGGIAARLLKEREIEKISDAKGYKRVEHVEQRKPSLGEVLSEIQRKLDLLSLKMEVMTSKLDLLTPKN